MRTIHRDRAPRLVVHPAGTTSRTGRRLARCRGGPRTSRADRRNAGIPSMAGRPRRLLALRSCRLSRARRQLARGSRRDRRRTAARYGRSVDPCAGGCCADRVAGRRARQLATGHGAGRGRPGARNRASLVLRRKLRRCRRSASRPRLRGRGGPVDRRRLVRLSTSASSEAWRDPSLGGPRSYSSFRASSCSSRGAPGW